MIRSKRAGKDSKDIRILDGNEDIGRVNEDGHIVYPYEAGMELIRGVRAIENARETIGDLRKELREYRMKPTDLKPLDLTGLTRHSDHVFTHVRMEDYDLRQALTEKTEEYPHGVIHNWLEFGQSSLTLNDRTKVGRLGARMRDGVTDFEHDSCYVVWIELLGVEWKFTEYNVSYFDAHITTNIDNIMIWDPSFKPEEVEGAERCDECKDKHWILPDGYFTPETSDLRRLVAGKRISIVTGPRWSKIEGDDDEEC